MQKMAKRRKIATGIYLTTYDLAQTTQSHYQLLNLISGHGAPCRGGVGGAAAAEARTESTLSVKKAAVCVEPGRHRLDFATYVLDSRAVLIITDRRLQLDQFINRHTVKRS